MKTKATVKKTVEKPKISMVSEYFEDDEKNVLDMFLKAQTALKELTDFKRKRTGEKEALRHALINRAKAVLSIKSGRTILKASPSGLFCVLTPIDLYRYKNGEIKDDEIQTINNGMKKPHLGEMCFISCQTEIPILDEVKRKPLGKPSDGKR